MSYLLKADLNACLACHTVKGEDGCRVWAVGRVFYIEGRLAHILLEAAVC
jgi:nitrate reductase cytochrome c-type subunit